MDDLQRAIERGGEMQRRARTAADALESSFAIQTQRASRALQAKGLLPEDSQVLQTLTRAALDPQRAQKYERQLESVGSQDEGASKLKEQFSVVRSAIRPREQQPHRQFADYAARARADYLEAFNRIDEQLPAFTREEREAPRMERENASKFMRDRMETNVVAYLTGIVREQGLESLETGRYGHTAVVSRIIEEEFQRQGYDLSASGSNAAHVNAATAKLIEQLPAALRAGRDLAAAQTRERQLGDIARRDTLSPNRDSAVLAHALHAPATEKTHLPTLEQQSPAAHLLQPDDELVEQKVSHSIGQTRQTTLSLASPPPPGIRQPQQKPAAHDLNADHREQPRLRYILTP